MEEKGSLTQKSSSSKAPHSLFTSLLEIPILCQNAAASSEQIVDRFGNPRYKTEMCRNFKERSKCIYGDKCQFAHGRRELRDVVRNTKYKTKTCQKYWKVGYCAYGPRCNFLHDELDEQTLMDWNSLYNADNPSSLPSRPTTPTNLFEVNHDLGEEVNQPDLHSHSQLELTSYF